MPNEEHQNEQDFDEDDEDGDDEVDDMYADLDASILLLRQQKQQLVKKVKNEDMTKDINLSQVSNHDKTYYPSTNTYPYPYLNDPSLTTATASTTIHQSDLFRSMQHEIEQLQRKLNDCQKETDNLKRNMGTLYRTAKSELERKNRRIEELEQQISLLSAQNKI